MVLSEKDVWKACCVEHFGCENKQKRYKITMWHNLNLGCSAMAKACE